jgi:hypothetical protein
VWDFSIHEFMLIPDSGLIGELFVICTFSDTLLLENPSGNNSEKERWVGLPG